MFVPLFLWIWPWLESALFLTPVYDPEYNGIAEIDIRKKCNCLFYATKKSQQTGNRYRIRLEISFWYKGKKYKPAMYNSSKLSQNNYQNSFFFSVWTRSCRTSGSRPRLRAAWRSPPKRYHCPPSPSPQKCQVKVFIALFRLHAFYSFFSKFIDLYFPARYMPQQAEADEYELSCHSHPIPVNVQCCSHF